MGACLPVVRPHSYIHTAEVREWIEASARHISFTWRGNTLNGA